MIDKNYLTYLIIFFIIFFFENKSFTEEKVNFLTLKNSKVNLRQGPSFEYPIKLIYKKKYLPVIVLDSMETWRKIRDFQNNTGWVHISQLSKRKSAINTKNNSIIYKKATIFSKPVAKIESGRLILIKKCKIKWCLIVSNKYEGWVYKDFLWGKIN